MCDFHCHILPRMDDGSKNAEESFDMLAKSHQQGVEVIVATPHYYQNEQTVETFLEKRIAAYSLIKSQNHMDIPEIRLGAEVKLMVGLSENSEIMKLCLEGTKYMLIEMPFVKWENWMYNELFKLGANLGIIPIIAHIDRYIFQYSHIKKIQRLFEMDVLIQANAEGFLRWRSRRVIKRLMEMEKIHLIGSDAHDLKRRAPNMDLAKKVIIREYGQKKMEAINNISKSVLSGGQLRVV